jgi:hypothetical protein
MRGTLQAPPPETVAGINFSSPAFAPATDAVRPAVTCCMFPCRFASAGFGMLHVARRLLHVATGQPNTDHRQLLASCLKPPASKVYPWVPLEHLLSDNLPYPFSTRSVPTADGVHPDAFLRAAGLVLAVELLRRREPVARLPADVPPLLQVGPS